MFVVNTGNTGPFWSNVIEKKPRQPITEVQVLQMIKAAENGHSDFSYELGIRYLTGDSVMQDDNLAAHYLALAHKQEHPKAFNKLQHAAAQGNATAAFQLQQICLDATNSIDEGIDRKIHQLVAMEITRRLVPESFATPFHAQLKQEVAIRNEIEKLRWGRAPKKTEMLIQENASLLRAPTDEERKQKTAIQREIIELSELKEEWTKLLNNYISLIEKLGYQKE